MLAAAWRS